jgi:hypothetical protein
VQQIKSQCGGVVKVTVRDRRPGNPRFDSWRGRILNFKISIPLRFWGILGYIDTHFHGGHGMTEINPGIDIPIINSFPHLTRRAAQRSSAPPGIPKRPRVRTRLYPNACPVCSFSSPPSHLMSKLKYYSNLTTGQT